MDHAIQVENLYKSYGNDLILKDLNFHVEIGEIFGILGVNGAGKTTLLECMEGLRKYERGKVSVNGQVGIQLQSASLPACIKPMEAIHLFAKWKKTKVGLSILSALGIDELARKQYCQFSTGQKRRLHLALALIGDPDILFLDEPTAGLDVEGRIALHNQIRRLKELGKTIILASHDMAEIEALCSRIAILNHGCIAFLGTVDELTEEVGTQYNIEIITECGKDDYTVDDIGESLPAILEQYKSKSLTILDIKINRGSFQQHFIEVAKGE